MPALILNYGSFCLGALVQKHQWLPFLSGIEPNYIPTILKPFIFKTSIEKSSCGKKRNFVNKFFKIHKIPENLSFKNKKTSFMRFLSLPISVCTVESFYRFQLFFSFLTKTKTSKRFNFPTFSIHIVHN